MASVVVYQTLKEEMNLDSLYQTPGITLKWIMDLNIKAIPIKLPEENTGEHTFP
jgi:hypothetical protein